MQQRVCVMNMMEVLQREHLRCHPLRMYQLAAKLKFLIRQAWMDMCLQDGPSKMDLK